MADPDRSALANLDVVWTSALKPAGLFWESRNQMTPAPMTTLAAANVIEAYAWLSLCVQAGCVPREPAANLMNRVFHWLSGAYELFSRQRAHPFEQSVWVDVENALRGRQYFLGHTASYQSGFDAHPDVQRMLMLWLIHCWRFMNDPRAQVFTAAVVFDGADGQHMAWQESIGPLSHRVFSVLQAPEQGELTDQVTAGYLKAIEHMDTLSTLVDVSGVSATARGLVAILRIGVGDMHQWRMGFSGSESSPFDWLTAQVERLLKIQAATLGTPLTDGGFIQAVEGLKRRWRSSFGPIAASAS